MPLVVNQLVDKMANKQDAEASPAQALLFTHGGVANGIVIWIIYRCVVQGARVETIAGIFYPTNKCVLEAHELDLNQRRRIKMAAIFDSIAKHLPNCPTNRFTDLG